LTTDTTHGAKYDGGIVRKDKMQDLERELSDAKSHVTRLLAEVARLERLANAGMAAETAAHNSEQKAERLERERDEARDKIAELWG